MNTSLKTCFKCGAEKARTEFYKHAAMSDGLLGKCKECTKLDVRLYSLKPETRKKLKEYEKARFKTPERKAKLRVYQQKRRAKNPVRYKAAYLLTNAIRDGRVKRAPCEVCGNPKSEGHHLDYSRPLAVRWLCFEHHRAAHGQRVREDEAKYAA